ncbi:MAG: heterodisulfide reductase-related iron-sulfur binding cluster [Deltaproteobacteria bacterium]|nr:heterodisulfide reductase-related iron-sulfur binding cluster [Deltaproteobacteria bacterium]
MEHSPFTVGNEGRQVFWNADYFEPFLFLFTAVALAIFAYGVYRRWQLWIALGKPERRMDHLRERIRSLLVNGLVQWKTFRDPYPGVMHGLIFFGFFVLIFGAAFDATEFHIAEPLGWAFLRGMVYIGFSFLMDLFGVAVLIGVLLAIYRRYVQRPDRLGYQGKPDNTPDDVIVLLFILGIIVTGFIIEALRIRVTYPPWEVWSFGGWFLAKAFTGVDPGTAKILHKLFWWIHAFLALGFIAYIPYSRLIHMITTPANHFMVSLQPVGAIEPIRDFETAESFGVGKLEEFTNKQIFDSDACTRCGRCQDGCPAYLSGKPLSPKKLIQDLKSYWLEQAPAAVAAKRAAEDAADNPLRRALDRVDAVVDHAVRGAATESTPAEKALIGGAVDLHELWACTNCLYCQENCSASIEHVPKVIQMRQYKVLTEADFAPELQLTFRNIENNSNPWGIGSHLRADWAKELGIPTLAEDPNVEYLFYVGCAGSFDDRGKKVSTAFAKILKAAGVSFGILGTEEGCCGDSAMRGGNEYLYQTLAQANIEVMKGYNVKKILATCPHGYNALKKDYPHFGGEFEVWHHTEIIADLIARGKIVLKKPVDGLFTYHDSCFLGRYNGIYDQPRNILKAVPGLKLTEMERNLAKSFCCGAGGARMWMEEDIGERINNMRTDQAIAAGADRIAVGCPFCLTMLTDGIKDRKKEEGMAALDIAEIVWKSMDLEEEKLPAEVCAAPSAS